MKPSTNHNDTAQQNFKRAKMLVVEDNSDHSFFIQKAVQQCLPEVQPVVVNSKVEALEHLSHCQYEEWDWPKLILLDLYLPNRQEGWEVLEFVRNMPDTLGKAPVVLLSSSTDITDIIEAYKRGCSSYLVKPTLFEDWINYFQMLRMYWWETVTLPKASVTLF